MTCRGPPGLRLGCTVCFGREEASLSTDKGALTRADSVEYVDVQFLDICAYAVAHAMVSLLLSRSLRFVPPKRGQVSA